MQGAFFASCAGLILFGTAVLVATGMITTGRPRRGDSDGAVGFVLRVMGWVLIAGGGLGLMILFFHVLTIPLLAVILVVTVMALFRARRARQYALLDVMAVAAERLMPLVPAIEAFAEEQRGPFAWQLRRMVSMLQSGAPLTAAFWYCRSVVPPEAMVTIRVGCESGTLAAALRQAVATRNTHEPLRDALAAKLLYLAFLPLFAAVIVTFLMLKIVPAFEKIFDDFEAELPTLTQFVIQAAGVVGGVGLLAGLAAAVLFFYAVLYYCGLVPWALPGMGWLLRRRDTAIILDSLALVTGNGRPILDGLASLAEAHPRWSVRRRLRRAMADALAGRDWAESLHAQGLAGRADVAVLQAAQRVGNLPWALAEMAESNRRRLDYRLRALLQVLFPLVLLAFGFAEMLLVVGLFLPLISLISKLT